MTKEYVQQYANLERTHWWFLVRQKIIVQFIKQHLPAPARKLTILNIGAAAGASSKFLSAFGGVTSVETVSFFIEYLEKENIAVTNASVTDLPFQDNSFDMVCAFDVIEHVADDARAMKEMTRVCRKDGALFLTVPASRLLLSQHDVVNGHYRRYTKRTLYELFKMSTEIKLMETRYFNFLLFVPILFARKISNLFQSKRNNQQSDFTYFKTPPAINSLLQRIFSLELRLLKLFQFPAGVSLISFLKKKDDKPQE